jgi:hypothetical protein
MAAGRSSSPSCRVSPSPVAAPPRRSGAYLFRACEGDHVHLPDASASEPVELVQALDESRRRGDLLDPRVNVR